MYQESPNLKTNITRQQKRWSISLYYSNKDQNSWFLYRNAEFMFHNLQLVIWKFSNRSLKNESVITAKSVPALTIHFTANIKLHSSVQFSNYCRISFHNPVHSDWIRPCSWLTKCKRNLLNHFCNAVLQFKIYIVVMLELLSVPSSEPVVNKRQATFHFIGISCYCFGFWQKCLPVLN